MSGPDSKKETEKFGRYDILELIATGGMAKIYKAQTSGERTFTLKKILPEYSENDEFIKMFLEEAKISLSLKHPNIVRVLDFGQLEGTYYLAMEYVFGKDLGSILKRSLEKRVHIPIDVACFMIMHCARGLDYAHTKSNSFGESLAVVHRDVSPPNLLVSYNGESKILDFGIAKAISFARSSNTRSGVLKGKFCYMSPEQARGENLNNQSDIFSLGIVFHELLTSRSLFYTKDEIETLERVRKAQVDPPSKVRKGVPKALDRIVLKALSAKTRNRYESCHQFADEINSFLKAEYPRTDARSVARLVRHLFPEDFETRSIPAYKEGWRDVLISGAEDSEIMLDRSLHSPSYNSMKKTGEFRINWWQRLLYDPKISKKFYKGTAALSAVAAAAFGIIFFFNSEPGQESLRFARNFFVEEESSSKTAFLKAKEYLEDKILATNSTRGVNDWVAIAKQRESSEDFEGSLKAYNEALTINPFNNEIKTQMNFVMLKSGKFETGCQWFNEQSEAKPESKALAAAICSEAYGNKIKALNSYNDFVRTYPKSPEVAAVKRIIKNLSSGIRRAHR